MLMLAQPASAATLPLITSYISTHTGKTIGLKLELAANAHDRQQGLMYRKTIGSYDGMAFFFRGTAPEKFWMKNTLIPLDILFVDEAGSIVYIVTGKPLSEEPVGPDGPVATVIELQGGRAARDGIAVGDRVKYDIDRNPKLIAQ